MIASTMSTPTSSQVKFQPLQEMGIGQRIWRIEYFCIKETVRLLENIRWGQPLILLWFLILQRVRLHIKDLLVDHSCYANVILMLIEYLYVPSR